MTAKYFYNDFELDFNKVTSFDIAATVAIMDYPEAPNPESEYVSWNTLGNYIMWSDGNRTYYFCKKYLRINGWDFTNENDRINAFTYLNHKQQSN